MPRIPIPLQSAQSDNPQANGERLVNLYAEPVKPGAKSKILLRATPGVSSFAALGKITGLYNADGQLFAATTTKFYRVAPNGTVTAESFAGAFGSDRTSISWNGTDFYLRPSDGAVFIDGYFVRLNGGGQIAWSNLYSTTFDPLDFATAEGSPDSLVGLATVHRELWLFGKHTTEIWYNSGDPDQTFRRLDSAFVEYGCSGGIATLDNTIFWLGDDGVVYTARGYNPVRISTHEIEGKIEDASGTALAWTYKDDGHGFYVLRFKDFCAAFDVTTGLWHEREMLNVGTSPYTCSVECYGKTFVGDSVGIWEFGDVYTEQGGPLQREFITPPLYTDEQRYWATCSSLEVLLETGIGLTTGQGSDPQIMMQASRDGGRTWENEKWRSIGKRGEYGQRVRFNRLGRFRELQLRFRMTDPVKWSIIGINAEVE